MSLRVTLFKFAKEHNSTARPSVSGDVTHVTLKDSTSFLNPILELQTATAATNPTGWNYAYISDFKRYYFINDWVYNRGIWEAHLMVDVLASWKEEIGGSTQYVSRSSHTYNGSVYDSTYPALAKISSQGSNLSPNPWDNNISLEEGGYVVGVISSDRNAVGSTKYFYMKQSGINSLCDALMDDATWLGTDFGDVTDDMVKAVVNPFQYIISATWFPFTMPFLPSSRVLRCGWYEIPSVSCAPMGTVEYATVSNVTIPKHPQAPDRGSYLNCPPYTHYILNVGPFGEHQIDGREIVGDSSLTIYITVDLMSGSANLQARGTQSGTVVLNATGQVGVQIPLAQASNSLQAGKNIVGAMGVVSGAAITNSPAQGLIRGISGAIGYLESITTGSPMGKFLSNVAASPTTSALDVPVVQELSISGHQGSIAAFQISPGIRGYFYEVAPEDIKHRGRPLCRMARISSIPGFILVENPELEIDCTEKENAQIIAYMTGGFYYA